MFDGVGPSKNKWSLWSCGHVEPFCLSDDYDSDCKRKKVQELRALLSLLGTVPFMTEFPYPRHPRKPSHRNELLRCLPPIQALDAIEVLLGWERGEVLKQGEIELIQLVQHDLGLTPTGSGLLARWMQRYVTEVRWLVEHHGPNCEAVLILGPTLSLQLFSNWLLVDADTEFERLSDVIYCPRVTETLVNLMPLPPDDLFEKIDGEFFVDPFDTP